MIFSSDLIYDNQDIISPSLQSAKVLEFVGREKDILEIGCHTGNLSRWLKDMNGCRVTGVDINPHALEKAKEYQVNTILADMEDLSFWSEMVNAKYDVITFMHVLEHLTDPWSVLRASLNVLKDDGVVIVALPNICNARDRFNIFFGGFNYTDIGVMDSTHLRFFNYCTAQELIDSSGLSIDNYYSPWRVNPLKEFLDHVPVLYKLAKRMSDTPPRYMNKKYNLTDTVMLFRCKK